MAKSAIRTWLEPPDAIIPLELQSVVGGNPLVAKILVQRGITSPEAAQAALDPGSYQPCSPVELPGMEAAAERLEKAIRDKEVICVWGDFDVDGQTATTVLVSTLRELGAMVSFHIPNREKESHGINIPVLKGFLEQGTRVLLTCDTGIAAHEAISFARNQCVDVIVTDHHELPPTLPGASAIINPRFLSPSHPLSSLAGVGVAYKLSEELYHRSRRGEAAAGNQDLVALGTVADLVSLTGDNRYMVQRGIKILRETRRLGLKLMMELAELNPAWLTEEHISFVLGPRLNALGRLDDANPVVDFLLTDNLGRARILATQLEALNARRKLLTEQIFQGALSQVDTDPSLLESAALVLSFPTWPAGVIGIVASRLVEQYHRPVIMISSPPGEMARGSARSIAGCNITAAIAAHGEMLNSYGGHPMAAGLSIAPERIREFRLALSKTISDMLGGNRQENTLQIDGYLTLNDLTIDFIEDLERLAPFGHGNRSPVLVTKKLELKSSAPVGRYDEHLLLTVEDDQGRSQRVVWWQGAGWELPEGRFDLAYTVRASNYRGLREVQVEWLDARVQEEPSISIKIPPRPIEVIDLRGQPHPLALVKEIQNQEEIQIWSEAQAKEKLRGHDRHELSLCRVLVIWTAPPGPRELQAALEQTKPEVVYLVGVTPGTDRLETFLRRLMGLVKYALQSNQGKISLSKLAAAMAQRDVTVRKGLDWLVTRGNLVILSEAGDEIVIAQSTPSSPDDVTQVNSTLQALLNETLAYRAYFAGADIEGLFG